MFQYSYAPWIFYQDAGDIFDSDVPICFAGTVPRLFVELSQCCRSAIRLRSKSLVTDNSLNVFSLIDQSSREFCYQRVVATPPGEIPITVAPTGGLYCSMRMVEGGLEGRSSIARI